MKLIKLEHRYKDGYFIIEPTFDLFGVKIKVLKDIAGIFTNPKDLRKRISISEKFCLKMSKTKDIQEAIAIKNATHRHRRR
jgi:hypothetical protein